MPVKKPAYTPSMDRIREIAYQLWLEAGQPEGDDATHWYRAEEIVALETEAPAPKKKAPARKKAA